MFVCGARLCCCEERATALQRSSDTLATEVSECPRDPERDEQLEPLRRAIADLDGKISTAEEADDDDPGWWTAKVTSAKEVLGSARRTLAAAEEKLAAVRQGWLGVRGSRDELARSWLVSEWRRARVR